MTSSQSYRGKRGSGTTFVTAKAVKMTAGNRQDRACSRPNRRSCFTALITGPTGIRPSLGNILIGTVLQYVSGLTIQHLANSVQRGQADRLGLSVLQDRDVGHRDADPLRELGHAHFSFGQHDIQIDDDRHPLHLRSSNHFTPRSEEHTSELQSRENLVCRLLLEQKKKTKKN